MARILLVDDSHDCNQTLATLLTLDHHSVCVAESGRAALDAIAKLDFDLILLDLVMPDMDGFEVAKQIRRIVGDKCLRIVALTGFCSDRLAVEGEHFDDVLLKPMRLEQLRTLIAGPAPT